MFQQIRPLGFLIKKHIKTLKTLPDKEIFLKNDKIIMYKELDYVYIVNGKRFLDKEQAEEYLRKYNKNAE